MATADNAEIANEENYVSGQEGQLRSAISNLGPNPYFTAGGSMSPSAYAVNPANSASFGTAAPQTTAVPQGGNMFAKPAASNLFAPPAQRQAQPAARSAAAG